MSSFSEVYLGVKSLDLWECERNGVYMENCQIKHRTLSYIQF